MPDYTLRLFIYVPATGTNVSDMNTFLETFCGGDGNSLLVSVSLGGTTYRHVDMLLTEEQYADFYANAPNAAIARRYEVTNELVPKLLDTNDQAALASVGNTWRRAIEGDVHVAANGVMSYASAYAHPDGSAQGDGSTEDPMTLDAAADLVDAGGEILLQESVAPHQIHFDAQRKRTITQKIKPAGAFWSWVELVRPSEGAADPLDPNEHGHYGGQLLLTGGKLQNGDGQLVVYCEPTYKHVYNRDHFPNFASIAVKNLSDDPALKGVILYNIAGVDCFEGVPADAEADPVVLWHGGLFLNGGYSYLSANSDGTGGANTGRGEVFYTHQTNDGRSTLLIWGCVSANSYANPGQLYSANGKDAHDYRIEDVAFVGDHNPDIPSHIHGSMYGNSTGFMKRVAIRRLKIADGDIRFGGNFQFNSDGILEDCRVCNGFILTAGNWTNLSVTGCFVANQPGATDKIMNIPTTNGGTVVISGNEYHDRAGVGFGANGNKNFAAWQALGRDADGEYDQVDETVNYAAFVAYDDHGLEKGYIWLENWQGETAFTFDPANLSLPEGNYTARNAQNPFDHAPTDTNNIQAFAVNVNGDDVTLSLQNLSSAYPIGDDRQSGLMGNVTIFFIYAVP